jgi:hypothetical protein
VKSVIRNSGPITEGERKRVENSSQQSRGWKTERTQPISTQGGTEIQTFFFLKGLGKTASSGKNQVFIKLTEN